MLFNLSVLLLKMKGKDGRSIETRIMWDFTSRAKA
jgi:hypothetical protein